MLEKTEKVGQGGLNTIWGIVLKQKISGSAGGQ